MKLAGHEAVAAVAFRFLILTATRTSETLNATWGEIDTGKALWTIPAGRMKGGRESRMSLSDGALAALQEVARMRAHTGPDAYVFPGAARESK